MLNHCKFNACNPWTTIFHIKSPANEKSFEIIFITLTKPNGFGIVILKIRPYLKQSARSEKSSLLLTRRKNKNEKRSR